MKAVLGSVILVAVAVFAPLQEGTDLESEGKGTPAMEAQTSEGIQTVDNAQLVQSLFLDYINAGRLERLSEIIAADYKGPGGQTGPSGFAATAAELRQAFPDVFYQIEDLISEGDRVVVNWRWTGTHKGAFRGFAPTQKRITNDGIGIFQVRDGKIARSWIQTDRLGFLQAIGAVPQDLGAPLTGRLRGAGRG